MALRTSDRLCIPSEARLLKESQAVIVFWSAIKRGITSVDPDEIKQCIKDIRTAYHAIVALSQGLPPEDIVNATDTLTEKLQTKLIHDQLSNTSDVVHEDRSEQSDVIQHNISGLAAAITESMAFARIPIAKPPVFNGDPLEYHSWKVSFI